MEVDFKNRSGRLEQVPDPYHGPGAYENYMQFGDDLNKMTIFEKRNQSLEDTPGPGLYDHERAEKLTKPGSQSKNFMFSPARTEQSHDLNPGPGQYGQHMEFGSDSKAMTIG